MEPQQQAPPLLFISLPPFPFPLWFGFSFPVSSLPKFLREKRMHPGCAASCSFVFFLKKLPGRPAALWPRFPSGLGLRPRGCSLRRSATPGFGRWRRAPGWESVGTGRAPRREGRCCQWPGDDPGQVERWAGDMAQGTQRTGVWVGRGVAGRGGDLCGGALGISPVPGFYSCVLIRSPAPSLYSSLITEGLPGKSK